MVRSLFGFVLENLNLTIYGRYQGASTVNDFAYLEGQKSKTLQIFAQNYIFMSKLWFLGPLNSVYKVLEFSTAILERPPF